MPMLALVQIRALSEYNGWANGHVLDAASKVSEEELARDLGASFGSVLGNLQHIVGAQEVWLARFSEAKAVDLGSRASLRTVGALREGFDASHAGLRRFVEALDEDALAGEFSYVDTRGVSQRRSLWQTMLHVVNHGTHHRAEAAMLLTSLGHGPRQLDYVFFEIERAGGEPRLT